MGIPLRRCGQKDNLLAGTKTKQQTLSLIENKSQERGEKLFAKRQMFLDGRHIVNSEIGVRTLRQKKTRN